MKNFDAYKDFGFDQFIEDPEFKNWVTSPSRNQDEFWKKFLAIYPEKETAIKEARAFLLGTKEYFDQTGIGDQEIQARLHQVLDKVSPGIRDFETAKPAQTTAVSSRHEGGYRKHRHFRRMAVAASIMVALGFLSWFWISTMNGKITYATNYGEWKTIDLPDGSVVKLNANSELSLPKNWAEGADRNVFLKGEAFFNISKKPASGAKFTVATTDLEVEVLGTAFNVHARGEATEIYLEEGEIILQYGDEKTIMAPGDFVAYSARKEKITARHRRIQTGEAAPDSWKDGVIIFTKENAFPILKKLEEIYGVAFQVKNESIYTRKYTVAVPMEELDIVVPILEKSMEVKIVRKNNLLILE